MNTLNRAIAWVADTKHSTYGLAVSRMILGAIVATQLMVNWPDRHYTWGDGASWTDPVRQASNWPSFLSLFMQVQGLGFDAIYVLTILAGLALAGGFCTRASAMVTLFLWMSLYVANPFVGSGGDAMLRMVLLYLCFTDAGRRWSADAWLRGRRGQVRPLMPAWFSTTLHNLALVLIVHQVLVVYVGSALWKVQSELWTNGTAVYFPLQTEAYSPWRDLIGPITAWSPAVAAATWTAIVIQLFFPVLLLYRPTRFLSLVAITGMHLAIGVFMGIMFFSLVMIAIDMLLVSDRTWAQALAALRQRWKASRGEKLEAV